MHPVRIEGLSPAQLAELDHAYRASPNARLRIRALMVLLAAERHLVAAEIGAIVRQDEETVRRWLARYQAEGIEGLNDAPRPGVPPKVTPAYRAALVAAVRRRPRSLDLPFSLWTGARLSDYLVESTGLRLSVTSVYRLLRAEGVHLSRPQHTITSPDADYAVKKRRWKTPAITGRRARCSTTPTSSTSPGTRRSARCGAPWASR